MPTEAEVTALSDAMWQLLDDMGKEGQCVCTYAKAQARIAYEPFLRADMASEPSLETDYAPDFLLSEAEAIVTDVNQG